MKPVLRHLSFFFEPFGCFFCVKRTYRCQDKGKNVALPTLKPILRHSLVFFEQFGGYSASNKRTIAKMQAKTLLWRLLNCFYSIFPEFLSTLVFVLRQSNLPLPNTSKNVASLTFRTILMHSPFSLEHVSSYSLSIAITVAKIRAKNLLRRLWNPIYSICNSLLFTLMVNLRKSELLLQRHGRKRWLPAFETSFTTFIVLFWVLW